MKAIIEHFYQSFSKLDPEGMAECYHPDVVFEDPAFGQLKGEKAKNMWRMLCQSQQGKDFKVVFSDIKASSTSGTAHWEAFYLFSKTGRPVHNIIEASFEFKDGKIIKHTDVFNMHRWAKQALGTTGLLLGWTPFFKKKFNKQANYLLQKFENKQQ